MEFIFGYVDAAPLFVFQWLFDEAQMSADSVGAPVTPQQWDYIHEMGGALRSSLDNVTAVFAPSCIGHAVLTKSDWMNIKIDDISLVDALRCWERSTRKHKGKGKGFARRNSDGSQRNRPQRVQSADSNGLNDIGNSTAAVATAHRQRHRLTKEERMRRRQNMTEEERERRRLNRIRKNQQQNGRNSNQNGSDNGSRRNQQPKNKIRVHEKSKVNAARQSTKAPPNDKQMQNNNRKRKRNRNNENRGRNAMHRKRFVEPKRCSLRLLERCSWPQCNHSCPALTNPLTGEEMRFLELLSSFGLDIEAVATALGIDMQTLNNMDHAELVNLLTQQVS